MIWLMAMIATYAPSTPPSPHGGDTASTGVDVGGGITIGIVLLIVAIVACIGYMIWDQRKRGIR